MVYRLVVFDWEGTLCDMAGQFIQCVAAEALRLGHGALAHRATYDLSLGPVVAVKQLFPKLSQKSQAELLQRTQEAMLTNASSVCLTPGAYETVSFLKEKGLHLAIATNRGLTGLMRDLDASGLKPFFDAVRTTSHSPPKPCPDMLLELMSECEVIAAETVMIGDSPSDMEMAHHVKVKAIGVDFYHQHASMLDSAGACAVFDNFRNVLDYLKLSPSKGKT